MKQNQIISDGITGKETSKSGIVVSWRELIKLNGEYRMNSIFDWIISPESTKIRIVGVQSTKTGLAFSVRPVQWSGVYGIGLEMSKKK